MKIHVCLVSAQAAANLLPALDNALKPQCMLLVTSPVMQKQARHLDGVLKEIGIRTEQLKLTNEHDYAALESDLLQWASRHEADAADTALNLTGGTKLMALAAQTVAQAAGWKIFYVDADTDQALWLGKDKRPAHKLGEHLRLVHYLRSYGYTPTARPHKPQTTHAQQQLMKTLAQEIGSLEKPLSQLNWLAQQTEDRRSLRIVLSEEQQDSRGLEALLRNFEDAGALQVRDGSVHFTDEAVRGFVKGGWLEEYAFQSLASVSGIRDKAANLEVQSSDGVKNEMDIAFLAHNRLFVIECKTARMDRPEAPKANDALFKLAENCRRIGGLGTRGMLLSYRALREAEHSLAKALNIEVVSGKDISRLSEKLKHWVGA